MPIDTTINLGQVLSAGYPAANQKPQEYSIVISSVVVVADLNSKHPSR